VRPRDGVGRSAIGQAVYSEQESNHMLTGPRRTGISIVAPTEKLPDDDLAHAAER
jgi:hypothetical protein